MASPATSVSETFSDEESQLAKIEDGYRKRLEARLYAQARALGYQLVPAPQSSGAVS